jgi:hypothetical protein
MVIKLFHGWDQREAAGAHTFVQSVIDHTSELVAFIPLCYEGMQKDASNAFGYSRFFIPELCNFTGFALFLDGADMLCKADIRALWDLRDESKAVQVVKHDYKTKFPRKYLGTEMECDNPTYPRKNWSSCVIWNAGHIAHFNAREKLRTEGGPYLHRFSWLKDSEIGELPAEWNWIPEEQGINTAAKILHFSTGIPAIPAHRDVPHAMEWQMASARSMEIPAQRRIAELASER